MATTAERWKAYQKVKASLSQEQQNVLSDIEFHMAHMELGGTPAELEINNDFVNCWRGGKYLEVENARFLIQLGEVDIGGPNEPTARTMFKMTRVYRRRDRLRFVIRLSDYFLEVIGAHLRDEKEA
ncbi:hypothetical protein [Negativicoccus succinicivorans]|uniref:hypothetical protein n=1 Tax=Negativicoccus succinicivorans TaxID=620903 RepID=UPI0029002555|nr:hypothetical protein [Negativicoccus succinicivorans]MDU2929060.1 hypothetical protein [Negativicoccus succinicivorans]